MTDASDLPTTPGPMEIPPPQIESILLEVARDAAEAGAKVLMSYFGKVSASETKSSGTDMVSEADLGSEAAIRKVLAERRPDDVVLGEEGGLARADGTPLSGNDAGADGEVYGLGAVEAAREAAGSSYVWICDPLDGTTNYLFGLRSWCVSVAVRDAEGTVCGVVVDPLAREVWIAARGGLAMLVDRHGAVTPLADAGDRPAELATALIGTGFAYSPAVRKHQAGVIADYIDVVRDVRRTGAAALDLCWAAVGRLDAYYERTVRPWDVAAGALLCEQVGLTVRYLPPVGDIPDGVIVTPNGLTDVLWPLVAAGAEPVDGNVIDLVA
ncbi:MAG: inositol monophosphatase family protein [Solirubrobacteraceae bacterium]|nr:inositol monophosphatase family protein [Solirubrobacteraceae bacterium]